MTCLRLSFHCLKLFYKDNKHSIIPTDNWHEEKLSDACLFGMRENQYMMKILADSESSI
jgi:hypothetical protein